MKHRIFEKD